MKRNLVVFVLRTIPRFIGATLFAITVWFLVTLSNSFSMRMEIPILIESSASQSPLYISQNKIMVIFKGEGWDLIKLFFKHPTWVVPIDSSKKNFDTIQTTFKSDYTSYIDIEGERKFKVTNIYPTSLRVKLGKTMVKTVPIRLSAPFQVKPGYVINDRPTIIPKTIDIIGAESVLKNIEYWQIKTPTGEITQKDFYYSLPITDSISSLYKFSQDNVIVKGEIETLTEMVISNVPIKINYDNNNFKNKKAVLLPDKISIKVVGPLSKFSKLKIENFQFYVNYRTILNDKNGYVIPESILPSYYQIKEVIPDKLQYILEN